MSVCSIYNRDPDRRKTWFVKGAPEIILKSCFALQTQDGRQSMTDKIRRNFMGEFKINPFSILDGIWTVFHTVWVILF